MANKVKHIFQIEGKCIADIFKSCVSNFSINSDNDAIVAALKIVMPKIYKCVDRKIWQYICNLQNQNEDDLHDWQCELLETARLTAALFIATEFISTPGLISDAGDSLPNGEKLRSTDYNTNARNYYYYCNRAFDAFERLIFENIFPNLELMGFDKNCKVVQKFCANLLQTPEQFRMCYNLPAEGGFSAFLRYMPYFKTAELTLQSCLCSSFYNCLLNYACNHYTSNNENYNTVYEQLLTYIRAYIASQAKLLAYRNDKIHSGKTDFKTTKRGNIQAFGKEALNDTQLAIIPTDVETFGKMYLQKIEALLAKNKNQPGFEKYAECFPDETPCNCAGCSKPVDSCGCHNDNKASSLVQVSKGGSSIFI